MQQRPNPDRPGLRMPELFSTAICLNLSDILAWSSKLLSAVQLQLYVLRWQKVAQVVVSERRSLSGRASLGGFVDGRGALSLASLSTAAPFDTQLNHFYPGTSLTEEESWWLERPLSDLFLAQLSTSRIQ